MSLLKSLKAKMSQKDKEDHHQNQQPQNMTDQKHTYHQQQSHLDIQGQESYAPPPGPPPSHATSSEANPPPYESWLSVPDTSQLPPPPNLSNEFSSTNNASFQAAEMGHKWCAKNQIYIPAIPRNSELVEVSQSGQLGLDPASLGFKGSIRQVDPQTWEIKTDKKQQDTILTSTLPVYFAAVSNPLSRQHNPPTPTTFSFSIDITTLHSGAGIAIGFTCKPYPPFRLPGWHRGSLAIHSDDGNRYVNDSYGGIDFARPFREGDNVRISMTVSPQASPVQEYRGHIREVQRVGILPKCVTKVTVERNSVVEGGWDIHEERDAERDEGIEGLQGEADLYCAVGVFGMTGFMIRFEGH